MNQFEIRKWATLAATALCVFSSPSRAQSFPSKPITIVVPYASGGATDLTARRIGEALSKSLSTPVIIENRPGASTTLAAAYVARAPKDGYTLILAPGTTTSVNPYLYHNLNYKPEDFAAISLVSRQTFALTTAPSLPANNVSELLAYAKGKPNGLTYGTTGTGSMSNIIGEWVGKTIGLKLLEIPYKGTAPASIDIIGGRLDMQFEGITTAIPMHTAGKIKILAILSESRSPLIPNVPTFRESGYPEIVAFTNFGLLAPSGTPDEVINKLHAAVITAVASPDFAAKLAATGEAAVSSPTPKHFSAFLREEYERWGRIVKPLNLKM